jgi:hypothetical protein
MDARTVEMVVAAAALGHAPHSDLLRQVLAGLGPAHTAPRVAQTQAAEHRTCAMNRYLPLEVLYADEGNGAGLPDGATPAGPPC